LALNLSQHARLKSQQEKYDNPNFLFFYWSFESVFEHGNGFHGGVNSATFLPKRKRGHPLRQRQPDEGKKGVSS